MQFHTFLHIARNSGLVQCDLLPASAPSVRSTQPSHHACFCSQWYLLQGHQSGAKQPEVTNRPMSRVRKQWYQRLAKNFAFSFRILNYWNLTLVWERITKQQWNVFEICAHKYCPLCPAVLPPAFSFPWSYCPKHSQLPGFLHSLRAHLFLSSLRLELRTSTC